MCKIEGPNSCDHTRVDCYKLSMPDSKVTMFPSNSPSQHTIGREEWNGAAESDKILSPFSMWWLADDCWVWIRPISKVSGSHQDLRKGVVHPSGIA